MTTRATSRPEWASVLASRDGGRHGNYAYKLLGRGDQFGHDFVSLDEPEVDEARMAIVLPFADGNRRDGVGDLLEIGGIDTSRHPSSCGEAALPVEAGFAFRGSQGAFESPSPKAIVERFGGNPDLRGPFLQDHSTPSEGNVRSLRVSRTSLFSTAVELGGVFRLGIFVNLSVEYLTDGSAVKIVVSADVHTGIPGGVAGMDNRDVRVFKFGAVDIFPRLMGSVYSFVVHVFDASSPREVIESHISWVAVGEMTTFHPLGAGADEGFEHQAVDESERAVQISVISHLDGDVSAFVRTMTAVSVWDQTVERSDIPVVGNLDMSRIVGVIEPLFGVVFETFETDTGASAEMSHGHPPSWLPENNRGAGGRDTAFRVIGPSPRSLSTERSPGGKGVAA